MSAGCELRRLNFSDDLFSEYAQSAPGTDGPVDTDLNRHEETTACTHDRGRTVSYYRSTWIATLGWCSSFAPASIAAALGCCGIASRRQPPDFENCIGPDSTGFCPSARYSHERHNTGINNHVCCISRTSQPLFLSFRFMYHKVVFVVRQAIDVREIADMSDSIHAEKSLTLAETAKRLLRSREPVVFTASPHRPSPPERPPPPARRRLHLTLLTNGPSVPGRFTPLAAYEPRWDAGSSE